VKKRRPGEVSFEDFIECLCAVHLSSYVEGPFRERSGLMVVGPPSVLKSTLLAVVSDNYPNALELSDVNVPGLVDLRDQLASGVIRTLVLSDLGKIYERHPSTALNLEGHLRALSGEGFAAASFQDSRINRLKARCSLLAGMVPDVQEQNFKRWEKTGFNRRYLWALIMLDDPEMLMRAVEEWRLLDFGMRGLPSLPVTKTIPNLTTPRQRRELGKFLKWQPGGGMHATQLALLSRMLGVLLWHYKRARIRKDAFEVVAAFARTLQEGGAALTLSRMAHAAKNR